MGVKEIIAKLGGLGMQPKGDDYDDMQTRDRYLRSLRRQRRIQLEEVEKEQLKREIKEYEQEKSRKNVWGMADKKEQVDLKKTKKLNLLGKI